MPTRKKAKGKTRAKRKKPPVTKATTRRRPPPEKRQRRKRWSWRSSPKKATPTANAAVKPGPAARPMPSLPAQPAPPGAIGVVPNYHSHLSVAILRLEFGPLRVGDVLTSAGHTTDLSQRVGLEVNHAPATEVGPNGDFGLKVVGHVREHDVVYKVRP